MTDTLPAHPSPTATDACEEALVRASSAGDASAFESLYRRHVGRVHGVILRLVGQDGARAEDLTQEAFVRAWQALPGYRFESAFGTWLYRLATNTALMELRSRRAAPTFEDAEAIDASAEPPTRTHGPGLSHDLDRGVASLPPRARAVLVLHDIEGWTHQEIGDALEMAVGSSKAQLHRARKLLRARFGGTP
ncbi:RNA polymerase sigma factor [Luteimonas vadosa]